MPSAAVVCGLLLIAVGGVGYAASDAPNPVTALIPAFAGLPIVLCGLIAFAAPGTRKHVMHAAAGLGLLGLLLSAGRLAMVLAKGGGSPLGLASLAAMALICGVFLVLCVRSFIAARRARTEPPAG